MVAEEVEEEKGRRRWRYAGFKRFVGRSRVLLPWRRRREEATWEVLCSIVVAEFCRTR